MEDIYLVIEEIILNLTELEFTFFLIAWYVVGILTLLPFLTKHNEITLAVIFSVAFLGLYGPLLWVGLPIGYVFFWVMNYLDSIVITRNK